MKQQVNITNIRATKFGVFEAINLDLEQFKNGIIAVKGNAGEGKSTLQSLIRVGAQGRNAIGDSDKYGDEWESEIQLSDGDRKIFISAKKKEGETPVFSLYEKDGDGKKVLTPIIDGVKATPAKYMEQIATEMTFGIKSFLSDDNTEHKKFMFKLFKPELEKQGVIFDKKNKGYEGSLLDKLEKATAKRDELRALCQHNGAFMSDFERDGHKEEELQAIQYEDCEELQKQKESLIMEKGGIEAKLKQEFSEKQSEIKAKGSAVADEIKAKARQMNEAYDSEMRKYNDSKEKKREQGMHAQTALVALSKLELSDDQFKIIFNKENITDLRNSLIFNIDSNYSDLKEPVKPKTPVKSDNSIDLMAEYNESFSTLMSNYAIHLNQYRELKPENSEEKTAEIDEKIDLLERKIIIAENDKKLADRYALNRKWVKACGHVEMHRNELAKLYAGVDTGVEGLHMKPFFGDNGKVEIKTVYNGNYDTDFFKNKNGEERLLVSYSSTQRPIIGLLLQIARMKRKSKNLAYMFVDDVPMDNKSREIITKLAEDNGLKIMTSFTGDFDKEKLSDGEMLVQGGEIFFNE